MNAQQLRERVRGFRLIGTKARTSNSYGRNLPYMRYRVMALLDDPATPQGVMQDIAGILTMNELKDIPYWSTRSDALAMTCWGTSQLFEAQLALGRWMGFTSKGDWTRFTRKCEAFTQTI